MAVSVIYNVSSGGGEDSLFPLLDLVTFSEGPVTYPLDSADGLEETMDDYTDDIDTDSAVVNNDTLANLGADKLATMLGWWDGAGYSGSGNWLNQGVGGALDWVLGAGGAAPSFAAGVFTFDGVDDYMAIADNALFDFLSGNPFSIGVIMTPKVAIVSGAAIMSKYSGSAAGYALAMASATTYQFTVADQTTTNNAGTQTTAVNTKQLFGGMRYSQAHVSQAQTHKVVGGAQTQTNNTLGASGGGRTDNALALTLGARPGLTNFCQMDVVGVFLHNAPIHTIDLLAIGAYYGV